jgi:hypothetical protein
MGGGSLHTPEGPALIFVFRADCEASGHAADALHVIGERLAGKGLQIVAISQDDEGDTAAFASSHGLGPAELGYDLPSLLASELLGIERTPTVYLSDGAAVVAQIEGWSRHEYNGLAALAARLVGAEAPTASQPSDGLPEAREGCIARNAG